MSNYSYDTFYQPDPQQQAMLVQYLDQMARRQQAGGSMSQGMGPMSGVIGGKGAGGVSAGAGPVINQSSRPENDATKNLLDTLSKQWAERDKASSAEDVGAVGLASATGGDVAAAAAGGSGMSSAKKGAILSSGLKAVGGSI